MRVLPVLNQIHFSFPLLSRELRSILRKKKTFVMLFLFLAALTFFMLQGWSQVITYWANQSSDVARVSRGLFFSLAFIHLLFLMIITPFMSASKVAEEREKGTLELLLSSPITPRQLVAAKLFAPLLFIVFLLTAAIPILSLCLMGGGLSPYVIFKAYLNMLLTIITFGSIGLFCSTLRPKLHEVYLITGGMILLYAIVIPFHGTLIDLIGTRPARHISETNHLCHLLNPLVILWEDFYPSSQSGSAINTVEMFDYFSYIFLGAGRYVKIRLGLDPLYIYPVMSLLVSVLMVFWARRRVQLMAQGRTSLYKVRKSRIPVDRSRNKLLYRDLTVEFSKRFIHQEEKAGAILERRMQWFARSTVLIRLFYSGIIFSIIIIPIISDQNAVYFFYLPLVVSILLTVPMTAASISTERERGTLDLLLTTLIPMREIIKTKFTSCFTYSFIIALALFLPGMVIRSLFLWFGVIKASGAKWILDILDSDRLSFLFLLRVAVLLFDGPVFFYFFSKDQ